MIGQIEQDVGQSWCSVCCIKWQQLAAAVAKRSNSTAKLSVCDLGGADDFMSLLHLELCLW